MRSEVNPKNGTQIKTPKPLFRNIFRTKNDIFIIYSFLSRVNGQ